MLKTTLTAAAVVLGCAVPSFAASLTFTADLSGDQEVPPVVTDAFGSATLTVDDVAETLDFSLFVTGLSLDDLLDSLVASPLGPVHIHDGDVGVNGPVVVPFTFGGPAYQDTADGFSLTVTDLAFSAAAGISGTALSFDDFLAELTAEGLYINIHTDAVASGELRGQLAPSAVPLPAGSVLLLSGVAGVAMLRRRQKARG